MNLAKKTALLKQAFSALANKTATELEHGWHGTRVNPWENMPFSQYDIRWKRSLCRLPSRGNE